MFGDVLLRSLGNMPFLNNGATFPTTSVRGCTSIIKRHVNVTQNIVLHESKEDRNSIGVSTTATGALL